MLKLSFTSLDYIIRDTGRQSNFLGFNICSKTSAGCCKKKKKNKQKRLLNDHKSVCDGFACVENNNALFGDNSIFSKTSHEFFLR